MDEVDRAIAVDKPDSWKGYTIGDPLFPSKLGSYWWLDDEKLMYPFYEKAVKAGITTVCIHKGLLPADYERTWPGVWEYATVRDVGKAAKDWPQLNFVMYHAALRPFQEPPSAALNEFERTGRIKWATDLAEIPSKFGVTNVYGEVGTAFATCATADPRFAAAFMGTLVRGLGADHVIWGSDSMNLAAAKGLTIVPLGPEREPVPPIVMRFWLEKAGAETSCRASPHDESDVPPGAPLPEWGQDVRRCSRSVF
jgi:uncharacterized protein